jgi:phage shock protein C
MEEKKYSTYQGIRLYRSRKNRVLAGICGGLGDYFNMDPIIFRVAWVALFFLPYGGIFLLYLIGMFVIPEEPVMRTEDREEIVIECSNQVSPPKDIAKLIGLMLLVLGVGALLSNLGVINYMEIRNYIRSLWRLGWPVLLIILGFFILLKQKK